MKENFKRIQNSSLYGILIAIILLASCKKDEKENVVESIPGFAVNTTIADLVKKSGQVEDELVVWGFVTAAGVSQNAPDMVWIQDDEAGIAVKIEEEQLSKFKSGTLLFVRAKDLAVKTDGSFSILTNADGSALTAADVEKSIGFGVKNQKIPVSEFGVGDLTEDYHQKIVTLVDIEVRNEDMGSNFGPAGNEPENEIIMQDCGGGEVVIITNRNSAIAPIAVPDGRGKVTGLFTINNGRKELRLLDNKAAEGLTMVRCAGSGDITLSRTIEGIINAGAGATIPANTELRVVNISSAISETGGGITVQDASGGIFIPGVTTANFPLDAALIINVSNKQVVNVYGRLAISGVSNSDIQIAGNYEYPPKISTVANMLNDDVNQTLVQLNNLQIFLYEEITGNKVYRLRDNSGKIHLTLANTSGVTVTAGTASVIGYFIHENGENKFLIRQQSDIISGGTAPNPDPNYIIENFSASYGIRKDNGNTIPNGKAYYYFEPQDAVNDNYLTAPTGKWLFSGALFWKSRTTEIVNPSAVLIGASAVNTVPATANFPASGPGYIESQFGFNGMQRVRVRFGSNASIASNYTIEVLISTDDGTSWTSLGTKSSPKDVVGTADFFPNIPKTEKVKLKLVNKTIGNNGRWGALMSVVNITVEQPE